MPVFVDWNSLTGAGTQWIPHDIHFCEALWGCCCCCLWSTFGTGRCWHWNFWNQDSRPTFVVDDEPCRLAVSLGAVVAGSMSSWIGLVYTKSMCACVGLRCDFLSISVTFYFIFWSPPPLCWEWKGELTARVCFLPTTSWCGPLMVVYPLGPILVCGQGLGSLTANTGTIPHLGSVPDPGHCFNGKFIVSAKRVLILYIMTLLYKRFMTLITIQNWASVTFNGEWCSIMAQFQCTARVAVLP